MDDHIAIVHDEPAFHRFSVNTSLFLIVLFCRLSYAFGKRVEHAVAASVADDEIVGKGCHSLEIKKQYVFALFVLQGFDDFMCQVQCVQISPQFCNGAENNFV